MTKGELLLSIARDEAQTLVDYTRMINETSDMDAAVRDTVNEIMGDELNHCLIALISAAQILDIHIATDDITPDPNNIEVE